MPERDGRESRAALLRRLVRCELPLEPTIAALGAFGWDSDEELVALTSADAVAVLERYLAGELAAAEVGRWAGALELREDLGFAPAGEARLRDTIFRLANPDLDAPITPALAAELRDALAGEAA